MYEHIGLDNIPRYMGRCARCSATTALFLNHAISRARQGQAAGSANAAARAAAPSPSTSSPAASSTTSATSFAGWNAPAWRSTTSKAGACTTRARCKLWHDRLTATRRGDQARRRGEIPHLRRLPGRRLALLQPRHAAPVPGPGSKSAKRPPAIPTLPRRPLPLTTATRDDDAYRRIAYRVVHARVRAHHFCAFVAHFNHEAYTRRSIAGEEQSSTGGNAHAATTGCDTGCSRREARALCASP